MSEPRRSAIVQVTRPPIGLWRFHWHELVPYFPDGSEDRPTYLPELDRAPGRAEVCRELRAALAGRETREIAIFVVGGYLLQVLDDRLGLLPDVARADVDQLLDAS